LVRPAYYSPAQSRVVEFSAIFCRVLAVYGPLVPFLLFIAVFAVHLMRPALFLRRLDPAKLPWTRHVLPEPHFVSSNSSSIFPALHIK
jgi:hypothetical protein